MTTESIDSPSAQPSHLIVRLVVIATSLVLLYSNIRYMYQVWTDTLAQGGRLWLMIPSLIVIPPVWALPLAGAAYPTLALWNRASSPMKEVGLYFLAVVTGMLAVLVVPLWSFAVLVVSGLVT